MTDDERQIACYKEIREVLEKYDCAFVVKGTLSIPQLDIQTDRLLPIIHAVPKPRAESKIIIPEMKCSG